MTTTYLFDSQQIADLYIHRLIRHQTKNNNPNPTSNSFINYLKTFKTIKATKSILSTTLSPCPICMDDFELDQKLVQLPCGHWYHRNCILPWLNKTSTCPMCRFQLAKQPLYRKEVLPDGYRLIMYDSSGRVTTLITVCEEGSATRICVEELL